MRKGNEEWAQMGGVVEKGERRVGTDGRQDKGKG